MKHNWLISALDTKVYTNLTVNSYLEGLASFKYWYSKVLFRLN